MRSQIPESRAHDERPQLFQEKAEFEHTEIKPSPDHDEISGLHEILFISLMCLGQLLTQAGVAQTINPFQYIADTIGVTSSGEVSWFSAAYSLTVGCFILISGRLGDMFGYKLMYILGFAWFGLWSLLCGLAGYVKTVVFFSLCRALQGIGPAFIIPNALGLIGVYYPPGFRKNMIMCAFGATSPSGFVIGSFFSALFAQLASWPWFFYTTAIVCAVTVVVSMFAIPANIGVHPGPRQSFDFLGAITGVVGLVLVNFAFNQGPVVGWNTVYVYVLLIVGVLFMVAFCFVEQRVSNPLVPRSVLHIETCFILGCIAAGWSCFGIWIYYTHHFGIIIQHNTVLEMSAKYVPAVIAGIIAAVMTGFLLEHMRTSYVMLMAMCAFCAGICIMGTRPVHQTYWAQMFPSVIITSFGMDMSFPAGVIIISQFLPKKQQGIAASLVNTVLNYSVSIGLGIAGTVEHYVVQRYHKTELQGFRAAYYTGMGLAGVGVILGLMFCYVQIFVHKDINEVPDSEEVDSDVSV